MGPRRERPAGDRDPRRRRRRQLALEVVVGAAAHAGIDGVLQIRGGLQHVQQVGGERVDLVRRQRLGRRPRHRATDVVPQRRDGRDLHQRSALLAAGERKVLDGPVSLLAFNSRAQHLAVIGEDGRMVGFDVHNEHPEVSFSALWGKVWYESYDDQRWLWQSSSASSDFEPKFSLTPLSVGTLKGAFYAMIFAIPIAVLGAIFTANFMSAEMRQIVKPSVEVLAALPSVILGFLAGLWLAPFVETNLPGVFLTLLLLPLSMPQRQELLQLDDPHTRLQRLLDGITEQAVDREHQQAGRNGQCLEHERKAAAALEGKGRKQRTVSPEARARMAAAQRSRRNREKRSK